MHYFWSITAVTYTTARPSRVAYLTNTHVILSDPTPRAITINESIFSHRKYDHRFHFCNALAIRTLFDNALLIYSQCWQLYFKQYIALRRDAEAFTTQLASSILIRYLPFPHIP